MDDKTCLDNIKKYKKFFDNTPELAWREIKTSKFVIAQLGRNFVWKSETGIVYKTTCSSRKSKTSVFFRTELDALNTVRGPKHVCGHSAHLAALMGAYQYFKKSPLVDVDIYFVFQPSEEAYPSGAQYVTENWPEIKKCSLGIAFHSYPSQTVGELIDVHMASGDYFEIKIQGKSTHIKNKNSDSIQDALLSAAQLITKINSHKNKNYIVNIGLADGGETPNSIAGNALLKGDIRSLEENDREVAYNWLKKTVNDEIYRSGLKMDLFYNRYYPTLKNDPKMLIKFEKVLNISKKITTFATEDFSLYPNKKLFLLIGTGQDIDLHEVDFETSDLLVEKIYNNWITIGNNLESIL